MKIHYDEQIDALYIHLDDSDIIESEEIQPGIIFDFNKNNKVVAIEILNVKFNLPQANLKQIQFEIS
jgi:uncharacterized protein YuzE